MNLNKNLFGISDHGRWSLAYDPDDDDWATAVDFEPGPSVKYLTLPAGLAAKKDWTEVLEEVVQACKQVFMEKTGIEMFDQATITAGFDEGDLVLVR